MQVNTQTELTTTQRRSSHYERERRRRRETLITIAVFAAITAIVITLCTVFNSKTPIGENGAGTSIITPIDSFHADYSAVLSGSDDRSVCRSNDGLYMLHHGYIYKMEDGADAFTPICNKKDCPHDDISRAGAFHCEAYVGQGYSDSIWVYNGVLYLVNFSKAEDCVFELCRFDIATGKRLEWSYSFTYDDTAFDTMSQTACSKGETQVGYEASYTGYVFTNVTSETRVLANCKSEPFAYATMEFSIINVNSFYNVACYFTGHYLVWYIDILPFAFSDDDFENELTGADYSYDRRYYSIDLDDNAPVAQRLKIVTISNPWSVTLVGAYRDTMLFMEYIPHAYRLCVYNITTGITETVYTGALTSGRACRIDGRYVYYIADDYKLYRVRYGGAKIATVMYDGQRFENAVAFDERYIYCVLDNTITVHDLISGNEGRIRLIYNDGRKGLRLTFSRATDNYVFAADDMGNLYRIATGNIVNRRSNWLKVTAYGG